MRVANLKEDINRRIQCTYFVRLRPENGRGGSISSPRDPRTHADSLHLSKRGLPRHHFDLTQFRVGLLVKCMKGTITPPEIGCYTKEVAIRAHSHDIYLVSAAAPATSLFDLRLDFRAPPLLLSLLIMDLPRVPKQAWAHQVA
jgi:hypothetical protein